MNNEDLLTELRWALDNIGASRDYFRIGNALESAIKALTPSATAVDHGYDRTASINVKRYVCTCGACMSAAIRDGGAPIAKGADK